MNAIPPSFPPAGGASAEQFVHGAPAQSGLSVQAERLAMRWEVLHEAVAIVASLAGREAGASSQAISDFPGAISQEGGWRLRLAEQGLDDISAILEPGISALLAVSERGGDTKSPAKALWREFETARDALLTLVPAGAEEDYPNEG